MRIALIHNQYIRRGGIETYLADLIRGFTDQGDEVTVICNKEADDAPLRERVRVIRTDLSYIPKKIRGRFFSRRLQSILKREQFDLTISLTRSYGQDISICGGTHRSYLSYMKKITGPLHKLEINLEQRGYDQSKLVIAHAELLQDELRELYHIDRTKIKVIHPPVDTNRFGLYLQDRRNDLRSKYGIASDRVCLVFPSAGHKRKGLEPLLKAMTLLPPDKFELLIVGAPAPKAGKTEGVRQLGFIREIEEVYTAADFMILPSFYEPFGLVVVESLMCGTPVLISNRTGARDVITSQDGMTFPDLRPESIAFTIQRAAEYEFQLNPDIAQRHSLKIDQHVTLLKEAARQIR